MATVQTDLLPQTPPDGPVQRFSDELEAAIRVRLAERLGEQPTDHDLAQYKSVLLTLAAFAVGEIEDRARADGSEPQFLPEFEDQPRCIKTAFDAIPDESDSGKSDRRSSVRQH